MKALKDRWEAWCTCRFPNGVAGEEIDGICLVSLDSCAAGCIETFISRNGKLNDKRIAILHECDRDLRAVLPAMKGEGTHYFAELAELTAMVLRELST